MPSLALKLIVFSVQMWSAHLYRYISLRIFKLALDAAFNIPNVSAVAELI